MPDKAPTPASRSSPVLETQVGARLEGRPRAALIAIAASAGGVQAVSKLLAALPRDFPVPIALVLHRGVAAPHALPTILARATALTVKLVEEGEPLRAGTVYVAPPDQHLVVGSDKAFHLADGRRIKFVRSSANPLFDSASDVLGGRVIAVVLTGSGSDGTDGVQAVKATGGIVIAQEPATAMHAGMPTAAIDSGAVDYVLPLERIAPALVTLTAD